MYLQIFSNINKITKKIVQWIVPLTRQFKTSSPLQLTRRNNKPTIRVPSKKALAAKARRKAAIAAKEEQSLLKLPLVDAVAILRVRIRTIIAYNNLTEYTYRLSKSRRPSLSLNYLSRPRSAMASQYQEEESLSQEKQNQDQKIKFLYLQKGDMPRKQERQGHTLSAVQS